jgi:flagellar biosynthesis regulator FlaF
MTRPGIDADNAFNEGSLESIESLLDATFFGNKVVELFAHDCGRDENVVDGWKARRI